MAAPALSPRVADDRVAGNPRGVERGRQPGKFRLVDDDLDAFDRFHPCPQIVRAQPKYSGSPITMLNGNVTASAMPK